MVDRVAAIAVVHVAEGLANPAFAIEGLRTKVHQSLITRTTGVDPLRDRADVASLTTCLNHTATDWAQTERRGSM